MKKRLIALLLVLVMLVPAGIASAATWFRVKTSSLKVRFLPGENTQVLGSYRKDYAATIQSTSDGWSYVTFSNGFEGYVQTKYLTKGSSYSAWVTGNDTALRRGPDGSFSSIANLAKGRKVKVLTHGAKYDFVDAGSLGSGYIVNTLLSKTKVPASGEKSTSTLVSGGNYDGWVMSTGKVNLRSGASSKSPSIAQYAPGTQLYVISHGDTWDYVTVDGNTGWMMTRFISKSAPAPTVVPVPVPEGTSYFAYVVSDNKKDVHVRKGKGKGYTVLFNVKYGQKVEVLEHNTTWDYINVNGQKGYIMNSFLQLSVPADAGAVANQDPTITPAPTPKFEAYSTTVNVNDLNFHKQKGDWSSNVDGVGRLKAGDSVKVVKIEGDWAKVEYISPKDGKTYTGWVHKKYLNLK